MFALAHRRRRALLDSGLPSRQRRVSLRQPRSGLTWRSRRSDARAWVQSRARRANAPTSHSKVCSIDASASCDRRWYRRIVGMSEFSVTSRGRRRMSSAMGKRSERCDGAREASREDLPQPDRPAAAGTAGLAASSIV
jgi:hypothetical protein